jgi:BirA family biotin operon repressor/biotin-[acetyl-CoA-carboxylase] ligase
MSGSTKLAGILIENSLVNDTIAHSIVGIGLNVNQKEFPPDLSGAVSMSQCTRIDYDLDALLHELVESIRKEIALIENGQYEVLRRGYEDKMFRRDAPHMFRIPGGEPFLAQIQGTTDRGLLILHKEDGSISHFAFKEVEYL